MVKNCVDTSNFPTLSKSCKTLIPNRGMGILLPVQWQTHFSSTDFCISSFSVQTESWYRYVIWRKNRDLRRNLHDTTKSTMSFQNASIAPFFLLYQAPISRSCTKMSQFLKITTWRLAVKLWFDQFLIIIFQALIWHSCTLTSQSSKITTWQ